MVKVVPMKMNEVNPMREAAMEDEAQDEERRTERIATLYYHS